MPPPEPRSRTTSPGLRVARAVGLPQPKDASIASSGTSPVCAESYRSEVIGSQPRTLAAVAPQQLLPPVFTRRAAWPYFSLTTSLIASLISVLGIAVLFSHLLLFICTSLSADLSTELDDVLRFDSFVSGAAFGIEELQKLLQRFGVGRVAQEGAFALYSDKVLALELFEMVGQGGIWNVEFVLNLVHHQTIRVG